MSEVKNEKGIHGAGGGLANGFRAQARVRKVLMGRQRERKDDQVQSPSNANKIPAA